MIFHETALPGAYLIDIEKRGDERGFFARVFCEKEFSAHGLVTRFVQVNNSLSADRGTLRGMHYQLTPHAETKLVRCIRGALWDVILDLRADRGRQRLPALRAYGAAPDSDQQPSLRFLAGPHSGR